MGSPSSATGHAIDEAWSLMHRLFLGQRSRLLAIASELELAPAQLGALKSLEPGMPVPMSRLADALACDNSNVTGIVDRLEAQGLVERRSAEHDRRVKLVAMTERGTRLRLRLVERLGEPPSELASLSADDQRALCDILRRAWGS